MFNSLPVILLTGYFVATATLLISSLVGAGLYNIFEEKRQRLLSMHPYSQQNKKKAMISVIVYQDVAVNSVLPALESIRLNRYHKTEIIVLDNTHSTASTTHLDVASFRKKYPKLAVRVIKKIKKTNRLEAVGAAVKKWAKGELVLTIHAESVLDARALSNINNHFKDSQITSLSMDNRPHSLPSFRAIFRQFMYLLRSLTQKLAHLINLNVVHPSDEPVAFRRTASHKQLQIISKYASDVKITSSPAASLISLVKYDYCHQYTALQAMKTRRHSEVNVNHWQSTLQYLLTGLRFGVTLLTPIMLTYFLYLALYFKKSALYGLAWLFFCVVALSVIWGKENFDLSERFRFSLFVPIVFNLLYAYSLMHVFVMAIIPFQYKNQNSTT